MSSDTEEISNAVLATKLDYVQKAIDKLDMKVSSNYVTKDEFGPIKKVVYGLVGIILTGVVTATVMVILK